MCIFKNKKGLFHTFFYSFLLFLLILSSILSITSCGSKTKKVDTSKYHIAGINEDQDVESTKITQFELFVGILQNDTYIDANLPENAKVSWKMLNSQDTTKTYEDRYVSFNAIDAVVTIHSNLPYNVEQYFKIECVIELPKQSAILISKEVTIHPLRSLSSDNFSLQLQNTSTSIQYTENITVYENYSESQSQFYINVITSNIPEESTFELIDFQNVNVDKLSISASNGSSYLLKIKQGLIPNVNYSFKIKSINKKSGYFSFTYTQTFFINVLKRFDPNPELIKTRVDDVGSTTTIAPNTPGTLWSNSSSSSPIILTSSYLNQTIKVKTEGLNTYPSGTSWRWRFSANPAINATNLYLNGGNPTSSSTTTFTIRSGISPGLYAVTVFAELICPTYETYNTPAATIYFYINDTINTQTSLVLKMGNDPTIVSSITLNENYQLRIYTASVVAQTNLGQNYSVSMATLEAVGVDGTSWSGTSSSNVPITTADANTMLLNAITITNRDAKVLNIALNGGTQALASGHYVFRLKSRIACYGFDDNYIYSSNIEINITSSFTGNIVSYNGFSGQINLPSNYTGMSYNQCLGISSAIPSAAIATYNWTVEPDPSYTSEWSYLSSHISIASGTNTSPRTSIGITSGILPSSTYSLSRYHFMVTVTLTSNPGYTIPTSFMSESISIDVNKAFGQIQLISNNDTSTSGGYDAGLRPNVSNVVVVRDYLTGDNYFHEIQIDNINNTITPEIVNWSISAVSFNGVPYSGTYPSQFVVVSTVEDLVSNVFKARLNIAAGLSSGEYLLTIKATQIKTGYDNNSATYNVRFVVLKEFNASANNIYIDGNPIVSQYFSTTDQTTPAYGTKIWYSLTLNTTDSDVLATSTQHNWSLNTSNAPTLQIERDPSNPVTGNYGFSYLPSQIGIGVFNISITLTLHSTLSSQFSDKIIVINFDIVNNAQFTQDNNSISSTSLEAKYSDLDNIQFETEISSARIGLSISTSSPYSSMPVGVSYNWSLTLNTTTLNPNGKVYLEQDTTGSNSNALIINVGLPKNASQYVWTLSVVLAATNYITKTISRTIKILSSGSLYLTNANFPGLFSSPNGLNNAQLLVPTTTDFEIPLTLAVGGQFNTERLNAVTSVSYSYMANSNISIPDCTPYITLVNSGVSIYNFDKLVISNTIPAGNYSLDVDIYVTATGYTDYIETQNVSFTVISEFPTSGYSINFEYSTLDPIYIKLEDGYSNFSDNLIVQHTSLSLANIEVTVRIENFSNPTYSSYVSISRVMNNCYAFNIASGIPFGQQINFNYKVSLHGDNFVDREITLSASIVVSRHIIEYDHTMTGFVIDSNFTYPLNLYGTFNGISDPLATYAFVDENNSKILDSSFMPITTYKGVTITDIYSGNYGIELNYDITTITAPGNVYIEVEYNDGYKQIVTLTHAGNLKISSLANIQFTPLNSYDLSASSDDYVFEGFTSFYDNQVDGSEIDFELLDSLLQTSVSNPNAHFTNIGAYDKTTFTYSGTSTSLDGSSFQYWKPLFTDIQIDANVVYASSPYVPEVLDFNEYITNPSYDPNPATDANGVSRPTSFGTNMPRFQNDSDPYGAQVYNVNLQNPLYDSTLVPPVPQYIDYIEQARAEYTHNLNYAQKYKVDNTEVIPCYTSLSDIDQKFVPSKIILSNEIKHISPYAFYGNNNNFTIELKDNHWSPVLTYIGKYAFAGCYIDNLDFSSSIASQLTIGENAFLNSIDSSQAYIVDQTTGDTTINPSYSLSLTFASLTNVITEYGAFESSGITSIDFSSSFNNANTYAEALFKNSKLLSDVTFSNDFVVSDYMFYGCVALGSNSTSTTTFNGVISFGDYSFAQTSYSDITLSSYYTNLGIENPISYGIAVFEGCDQLQVIRFDTSATIHFDITDYMFAYNSNILSISFDNVDSIGKYAFINSFSSDSTINASDLMILSFDDVSSIDEGAFAISDYQTIYDDRISASEANEIYQGWYNSFQSPPSAGTTMCLNSKIKFISIKNVSTIKEKAFANLNNLTSVFNVRANATSVDYNTYGIADYQFYNCYNLQSYGRLVDISTFDIYTYVETENILRTGTNKIGNHTFENNTGFYNLLFGTYITSIGDYAFYNSKNSYTITIPVSITTIGDYAFSKIKNSNLTYQVIISSNNPTLGDHIFENSNIASFITGTTLSAIPDYAFYNCGSLVWIGSTSSDFDFYNTAITTIGQSAFENCVLLGSDSAKMNHILALYNKTYQSATIGVLTSIGNNAFKNCISITTIVIADDILVTVGDNAFASNTISEIDYWTSYSNKDFPDDDIAYGAAHTGYSPNMFSGTGTTLNGGVVVTNYTSFNLITYLKTYFGLHNDVTWSLVPSNIDV